MLPRFVNVLLLALVAAAPLSVRAASSTGTAGVVAVEQTRVADLVMLGRGFDAGFRQGMVCRVLRGPTEVAEILVVDLRPSCSAALILNVARGQSIRAGDVASIKVLKS